MVENEHNHCPKSYVYVRLKYGSCTQYSVLVELICSMRAATISIDSSPAVTGMEQLAVNG